MYLHNEIQDTFCKSHKMFNSVPSSLRAFFIIPLVGVQSEFSLCKTLCDTYTIPQESDYVYALLNPTVYTNNNKQTEKSPRQKICQLILVPNLV